MSKALRFAGLFLLALFWAAFGAALVTVANAFTVDWTGNFIYWFPATPSNILAFQQWMFFEYAMIGAAMALTVAYRAQYAEELARKPKLPSDIFMARYGLIFFVSIAPFTAFYYSQNHMLLFSYALGACTVLANILLILHVTGLWAEVRQARQR